MWKTVSDTGADRLVAPEDKFDRLQHLIQRGKEKAYALYDELSEVLPTDLNSGAEMDDLLTVLDGTSIEILEEPKLEFEKKLEETEELLDLDPVPGIADKGNDPVRMYLREMGAVPLLTRDGEIEIARRIERGQNTVMKTLSRSPLVIQEVLNLAEEVRRGTVAAREVILVADPMMGDEAVEEGRHEFAEVADEVGRLYRKFLQCRQKLLAVPRGLKPKQYRRLQWEMARVLVRLSRRIRTVRFQGQVLRHFTRQIRAAVEEMRPVERELARVQRRTETWPARDGRYA